MVARRVLANAAFIMFIALVGGCAKKAEDQAAKQPMTTAQRDSAIGESKLPGAGAVKKALEQSDSAKVRSQQPIPEPR